MRIFFILTFKVRLRFTESQETLDELPRSWPGDNFTQRIGERSAAFGDHTSYLRVVGASNPPVETLRCEKVGEILRNKI
jgi:hypothetical protein